METNHTTVMFAKEPVSGRVKTRLAEGIGAQRAADLYAAFIGDIADTIATTNAAHGGRAVLAYAGSAEHAGFEVPRANGFDLVAQPAGGLGARLDAVFRELAATSDTVIVVGSDSPTLSPEHIVEARHALRHRPVVLGPSFDGGYYLLGVRSQWFLDTAPTGEFHALFRDIPWSTSDVLGQTLRRCAELSTLCELLGFWYDVDTINDLDLLRTHLLGYLRLTGLPSVGRDVAPRTAAIVSSHEADRTDPNTP